MLTGFGCSFGWILVIGFPALSPAMWAAAGPADALVLEYKDRWTQATGAVQSLERAGFGVRRVDPANALSVDGVELILFGSFCSEHPGYSTFVARNRAQILEFVKSGGVVVHMTQADQTESSPPILPPGKKLSRGDTDLSTLYLVTGEHPLLDNLPVEPGKVAQWNLPTHLGRPANWESFHQTDGFRVLLSSDRMLEHPALLETAHGSGRLVFASLFLDKILRDGEPIGAERWRTASEQFFTNLKSYVGLVQAGEAPAVEPTVPPEPIEPLPWVPGSWTLAVLPDTQVYSMRHPELFEKQTRWIARNVEERNIAYVLHLGDIVNNNNTEQWQHAEKAMRVLDGRVPYAMAPGNHDYGDNGTANNRETLFNDYFPLNRHKDWPTLGGVMEKGRMDNSFHLFKAGGKNWLVLALEWGPRNTAVQWANDIVEQYPERKAILITHAYLYYDSTRYNWAEKGAEQSWNPHAYGTANHPEGTNDGEELWQKLVSRHENFVLTFNGHVLGDGQGLLSSKGKNGNRVHQMLVNYQMRQEGGQGYLRLLEFLPDGRTVYVKTYSPNLDRYLTDPQNQFMLEIE